MSSVFVCQDWTWEGQKVSARGRQKKEEGGPCFLSASSQSFGPSPFACVCFVGAVMARMRPSWRQRWKALWWLFKGLTDWNELMTITVGLFLLLLFPDLIKWLHCLGTSVQCFYSSLFSAFWFLNLFSLLELFIICPQVHHQHLRGSRFGFLPPLWSICDYCILLNISLVIISFGDVLLLYYAIKN